MIIDTCALVEWLLKRPRWQWVAAHAMNATHGLNAPYLLDAEFTQVVRKLELSGKITPSRAEAALEDFLACPIERYPHEPLVWRTWAHRQNLTAYDALFVTLGEALEMPLLTLDVRIGEAPNLHTDVILPK